MRVLLGCLLLGISLMVDAEVPVQMTVNATDHEFVIILPANPTTGFQWSIVNYDKDLLILSSSSFEQPKTHLIGAGGQMRYVFQLKKGKHYVGSTKLQFKYARTWEPETATVKTIKVNFVK